jgi:hypothetical protein
LLAGLGLCLTGCAAAGRRASDPTAAALWPHSARPGAAPGRTTADTYRPIHRPAAQPTAAAPAPTVPVPVPGGVVARRQWTRHGLAGRNANPMGGVKKITIHHEGWTPVTFTSATAAYDRIETIRQIHTRDRGWADIGYHYIIDRAGRVIEGRPIAFQGAHVADNNPHNLGILVLGNFQKQRPSPAQVKALGDFTRQMMQLHRVPKSRVLTHREINPTQCPGRFLQAEFNTLRTRGVFA